MVWFVDSVEMERAIGISLWIFFSEHFLLFQMMQIFVCFEWTLIRPNIYIDIEFYAVFCDNLFNCNVVTDRKEMFEALT